MKMWNLDALGERHISKTMTQKYRSVSRNKKKFLLLDHIQVQRAHSNQQLESSMGGMSILPMEEP